MNPTLAGVVALILWSISPLLIIGTGDSPPFLMGTVAMGFSAALCLFRLKLRKESFSAIARQPFNAYALTTFGMGGYVIFWFLAFKNAPAFEANTLNYLWPILLVLLSYFLMKERLSAWVMVGLISGFLGATLLFSQANSFNFSAGYLSGYVFAIIGALIWAVYSAMTRYVPFPNGAMAFFMIPPAVLCFFFHLLIEKPYQPTFLEWGFMLALGFTRISFVFWDYAMKHGQLTIISSLSYFIPVVSTGLLVLFGFIPRNEMIFLSAMFVLGGCLLVNFSKIKALLVRK